MMCVCNDVPVVRGASMMVEGEWVGLMICTGKENVCW